MVAMGRASRDFVMSDIHLRSGRNDQRGRIWNIVVIIAEGDNRPQEVDDHLEVSGFSGWLRPSQGQWNGGFLTPINGPGVSRNGIP